MNEDKPRAERFDLRPKFFEFTHSFAAKRTAEMAQEEEKHGAVSRQDRERLAVLGKERGGNLRQRGRNRWHRYSKSLPIYSMAATASAVTRCLHANMRLRRLRIYQPAKRAPSQPRGRSYSTRSSSSLDFSSTGKKRCVCSHRGNGPETIESRNILPGSQAVCSAIQVMENGPTRTASVTREPGCSMPPVRETTRADSQGGCKRSSASGRA